MVSLLIRCSFLCAVDEASLGSSVDVLQVVQKAMGYCSIPTGLLYLLRARIRKEHTSEVQERESPSLNVQSQERLKKNA